MKKEDLKRGRVSKTTAKPPSRVWHPGGIVLLPPSLDSPPAFIQILLQPNARLEWRRGKAQDFYHNWRLQAVARIVIAPFTIFFVQGEADL